MLNVRSPRTGVPGTRALRVLGVARGRMVVARRFKAGNQKKIVFFRSAEGRRAAARGAIKLEVKLKT
jgi:hypothetical protein